MNYKILKFLRNFTICQVSTPAKQFSNIEKLTSTIRWVSSLWWLLQIIANRNVKINYRTEIIENFATFQFLRKQIPSRRN